MAQDKKKQTQNMLILDYFTEIIVIFWRNRRISDYLDLLTKKQG
jgi:hypothetical protein